MKEVIEKECFVIEDMIYEVKGTQVMFSKDVSLLYQVETKRLNEVVKRNMNRFLELFCFQLTEKEFKMISSGSQIATLNKSNNLRGYNIKYLPYVLTEQGIMVKLYVGDKFEDKDLVNVYYYNNDKSLDLIKKGLKVD